MGFGVVAFSAEGGMTPEAVSSVFTKACAKNHSAATSAATASTFPKRIAGWFAFRSMHFGHFDFVQR